MHSQKIPQKDPACCDHPDRPAYNATLHSLTLRGVGTGGNINTGLLRNFGANLKQIGCRNCRPVQKISDTCRR